MPRIYVVLRLINQVEIANAFIDEEITDLGFPFTRLTLPHAFADQTARHNFLKTQPLVCSTLLELAWGTEHHHFARESDIPLVILSDLGSGGYGFVDRVFSEVTMKEYARKRIPRGVTFKKDRLALKVVENELHHLRRLAHEHIVQFVGSYTDPKFVGILMSPVAECNLKQYLNGSFEKSRVRSFFGCLAIAVRYLHENQVKHKDIKPENVLVHRGTVLLTDFGISRNWTEAGHSTTTGKTPKSARYCAPEVADEAPRNSSSDIWSLGCVFLEMWSVVSGHSLEALTTYLENTESYNSAYHMNSKGIEQWCALKWPGDSGTSGPLHWIRNMLQEDQKQRWIIQKLSDFIQEYSEERQLRFVGLCCDSSIGYAEPFTDAVEGTSTSQILRGSPEDDLSKTNISLISSLGLGQLHLGTDSASMGVVSPASGTGGGQQSTLASNATKNRPLIRNSGRRGNTRPSHPKRAKTRSEGDSHNTHPEPERHFEREDLHYFRPSEASQVQRKLPNSFVLAQVNRFTRGDVIKLLPASQNSISTQSRPTRLSKGFEEILFSCGDCMLPNVVYAATCVRSKPSQYARWSTLKGLVQHMTPGVIHGYSRLCSDAREGMSSLPTIVPTGSRTDTVEGMLIFGFHDSHARGSRRYESKNEHSVQDLATIQLRDETTMDIQVTFRVWNEDRRDALSPFQETWTPLHLLDGEWYSLFSRSVTREDEELAGLIPGSAPGPSLTSQQEVLPTIPTLQSLGFKANGEDMTLTKNSISMLFHKQARYFILKEKSAEAIQTFLDHGIWSSTPAVNAKLDRAFKESMGRPIVVFLVHPSQGFSVDGLHRAQIPLSEFSHIREQHNVEGQNASRTVGSCKNGTEVSLYPSVEILRLFEQSTHSTDQSSRQLAKFEDRWTVLLNPESSVAVELNFVRSIALDNEDGDYGITFSADGKYVAVLRKAVEVFEADSGSRVSNFDLPFEDEIHSASFDPDAKHLAVAGECGVIYVWNLKSESLAGSLIGHTAPIFSLEYSAEGSRIVSGSEDRTVRVWDAKAFTSYRFLQIEEGCVTISSTPDCSRVFAGTLGGKLLSWNISSDKEAVVETLCVHNDSIFGIQYMPGLDRVVTGSRDQTVNVWSMAETEFTKNISTPLNKLLGHKDSVYSVDVSPDNKIIFSASGDGSVRLWNSITGELIGTILGVGLQRFHDLSVCKTKSMFTTAGRGEGIQIWSYEVKSTSGVPGAEN